MVAEIPDPQCSGVCVSKQFDQINRVRDNFARSFLQGEEQFLRPTSPIPITITGVGFFDFYHGQLGMAPNGIELHPVLNIAAGQ
jgi:hypothetical protein